MFVTKNQIYIFIACISFGILNGIVFGILSLIKKKLKNQVVKFIIDLSAFVVMTLFFILFSYLMHFSDLRLYMACGVFIGIYMYFKTLHILLAKNVKKIYNVYEKILAKVKNVRKQSNKNNHSINCRCGSVASDTSFNNGLSNDCHRCKTKRPTSSKRKDKRIQGAN